jgi:hypothetical protein
MLMAGHQLGPVQWGEAEQGQQVRLERCWPHQTSHTKDETPQDVTTDWCGKWERRRQPEWLPGHYTGGWRRMYMTGTQGKEHLNSVLSGQTPSAGPQVQGESIFCSTQGLPTPLDSMLGSSGNPASHWDPPATHTQSNCTDCSQILRAGRGLKNQRSAAATPSF